MERISLAVNGMRREVDEGTLQSGWMLDYGSNGKEAQA